MKLSVKGMALACGILWALCILCVGGGATILGVTQGAYYGKDFLLAMASIYPGYHGTPGLVDTLVGAGYALLDGLIGGAVFAWLYNCFACGAKSE